MRSDGATCGYCGCLPTRHSKTMPATLTLLVAHRLREKVKVQVQGSGKIRPEVVPEVVGSSPSSLSDESSPETDFIPEPRAETSKYGRKRRG